MWAKAAAGVLLGLPLSLAACGALSYAWPGTRWQSTVNAVLLAFFPLWLAVISVAVGQRSARQTWLALGVANLLAFSALWAARLWHG
ncbi:hypothetical protein ABW99_07860 [Pandoraea thiooxydans]|uniref:Transmembrane lipoprotein n=1 Tax=Pandoraea thiooxydans TaxID=445709 RepID=A0A0G3F0E3_9BURK|nr:hypothetical protein ABW99_07860 [Pandoraea thiooxydans]